MVALRNLPVISMVTELHTVVQLALGLVFLCSSIPKLWHLQPFLQGFRDYVGYDNNGITIVGVLVVLMELTIAGGLLTNWQPLITALVMLGVLAAFFAANVVILLSGKKIPCLCFGLDGDELVSWMTVSRLLLMIVGAGVLLITIPVEDFFWKQSEFVRLTTAFACSLLLVLVSFWVLQLPKLFELYRD